MGHDMAVDQENNMLHIICRNSQANASSVAEFTQFSKINRWERSRQAFVLEKECLKMHGKPDKSQGTGQFRALPWIFKHYILVGKAFRRSLISNMYRCVRGSVQKEF